MASPRYQRRKPELSPLYAAVHRGLPTLLSRCTEADHPLPDETPTFFYTMGEWGTDPNATPFEGFNFRTSSAVDQVRVSFSLYQEQGTLTNNRDDTPSKSEEQAAFYDDIVIGCRIGG